MYIEFLGIPGSGKTFHANLLKTTLTEKGDKFLDVSRQKIMLLWLKIFYKLAETILIKLPKYRRQTKEYIKACHGCSEQPVYLPFTLKYCIKDIVLASLLHDIFRSKRIVYINDEGQLQRIVFLIVQYNVPFDMIMPIYAKYKDDVKTLYIQTAPDKAFENIKSRNRHVCPMDEMEDEKLKAYLEDFFNCCEKLNNENLISQQILLPPWR